MRIDSAITSGVQGWQRGEQMVDQAASQIASLNTPAGEQVQLPNELVNLKTGELQAAMSAEVLETADEMAGYLFDIRV